jgi:hypothetical protein
MFRLQCNKLLVFICKFFSTMSSSSSSDDGVSFGSASDSTDNEHIESPIIQKGHSKKISLGKSQKATAAKSRKKKEAPVIANHT